MDGSILYIEKLGSKSIIHFITEKKQLDIPLLHYLNNLCLKDITTLDGRIKAIKQSFKMVKNVPIYINDDMVLFTINELKAVNNLFINSCYIKNIEQDKDNCVITFYNNVSITVNKQYHLIKSKLEKCLKIKTQINHYC